MPRRKTKFRRLPTRPPPRPPKYLASILSTADQPVLSHRTPKTRSRRPWGGWRERPSLGEDERFPGDAHHWLVPGCATAATPAQLLPAYSEHPGVFLDGIVGVVTTQLGVERSPLFPQTEVPIFTTPLTDGVECAPEPLTRGLRLHPKAAPTRLPPVEREPKEIERP
jgi:hypothetical protein